MNKLPKLKTKGTLAEQTYDTLKKAIIELKFKPGELITEEEIAEQLGVSRTPLRTAFNQLLHEELLVLKSGKGTYVSELTSKQMEDMFSVRRELEKLAVVLATEFRTEEELQKLKALIDTQSVLKLEEHEDYRQYFALDVEIHSLIAQMSKNEYLAKQLLQIMSNCSRYLYTTTFYEVLKAATYEHYDLYEKIKMQNKQEASAYMEKHINNIKERMVLYLESKEDNK